MRNTNAMLRTPTLAVVTTVAGCALIISGILWVRAEPSENSRVIVEGGDLWELPGSGKQRQLLAQKGQFVKAKCDDLTYFACFRLKAPDTTLLVMECSSTGKLKRRAEFQNKHFRPVTALMEARALSSGRIFIDGHINPSLGLGIIIDLDSKNRDAFLGYNFVWDHAGQQVAYVRAPPHFGTPPDVPDRLWVDHTRICELPPKSAATLLWDEERDKLIVVARDRAEQPVQLVVVDLSKADKTDVMRYVLRHLHK